MSGFPTVRKVTSIGSVVSGKATYLEGLVACTDRPIRNVKRPRRLEAESSVEGGTAEQNDQRKRCRFGSPKEFAHKSAPDALALLRWRHRQRGYGDHLSAAEIATGSQHMPNDHSVLDRCEFEFVRCRPKRPRSDDDVHLFLTIAILI
jgi:hypothetical protein